MHIHWAHTEKIRPTFCLRVFFFAFFALPHIHASIHFYHNVRNWISNLDSTLNLLLLWPLPEPEFWVYLKDVGDKLLTQHIRRCARKQNDISNRAIRYIVHTAIRLLSHTCFIRFTMCVCAVCVLASALAPLYVYNTSTTLSLAGWPYCDHAHGKSMLLPDVNKRHENNVNRTSNELLYNGLSENDKCNRFAVREILKVRRPK